MVDRIRIQRELTRGDGFKGRVADAWLTIWDNFDLLRSLVGYEDVTFEPTAGANEVAHKLGEAPDRWYPIHMVDITASPYEKSTQPSTASVLNIFVTTVGPSPSLTVRAWKR